MLISARENKFSNSSTVQTPKICWRNGRKNINADLECSLLSAVVNFLVNSNKTCGLSYARVFGF